MNETDKEKDNTTKFIDFMRRIITYILVFTFITSVLSGVSYVLNVPVWIGQYSLFDIALFGWGVFATVFAFTFLA